MEPVVIGGMLEWVWLAYVGFVLPFFLLPR